MAKTNLDEFCGRFHFAQDMNGDLAFTVTDVWQWFIAAFYLPAKLVTSIAHQQENLSKFFEVDCATGTGIGGGVFSFFVWALVVFDCLALDFGPALEIIKRRAARFHQEISANARSRSPSHAQASEGEGWVSSRTSPCFMATRRFAPRHARARVRHPYDGLELEYQVPSQMLKARSRAVITPDAVAELLGTPKSAIPPPRVIHPACSATSDTQAICERRGM